MIPPLAECSGVILRMSCCPVWLNDLQSGQDCSWGYPKALAPRRLLRSAPAPLFDRWWNVAGDCRPDMGVPAGTLAI
jgi:hypothetical protein